VPGGYKRVSRRDRGRKKVKVRCLGWGEGGGVTRGWDVGKAGGGGGVLLQCGVRKEGRGGH